LESNPYDERPLIWVRALELFWERPIFGWGPGTFSELSSQPPNPMWNNPAVHAHNGLLTVTVEGGLVLAIAALAVVGLVTLAAIRGIDFARSTNRRWIAGILAGVLAGLSGLGTQFTIDYTLRSPMLHVTTWFLVGLILACAKVCATGAADVEHRGALSDRKPAGV
jgi:O-antigen ligase